MDRFPVLSQLKTMHIVNRFRHRMVVSPEKNPSTGSVGGLQISDGGDMQTAGPGGCRKSPLAPSIQGFPVLPTTVAVSFLIHFVVLKGNKTQSTSTWKIPNVSNI